MSNYLRSRRKKELYVAPEKTKKASVPRECPYCRSASLETHGTNKFCRNCHRYV